MYGNATAEDFWGAQTEVSHRPIDKIMDSFVSQPGEPVLDFGTPAGGAVSVSQQRFFLNPTIKSPEQQQWSVPVCIKTGGQGQDCEVLSPDQKELKVPSAPFLFADAGGAGYYRYSYSPDVYSAIAGHVEDGLSPEERISLLGNQWAQVHADKASVGDFLNLASAVKDDSSYAVVEAALGPVVTIDERIANTPEEHAALAAWVNRNFRPAYERLGPPSPNDPSEKQQLRGALFSVLGEVGKDPGVIAEAKQIAEKYLADPASVDATLAQPAETIAAENGDAAFFDQLQKTFETSDNPQMQEGALRRLTVFHNPDLEQRALELTVSGKVKNQDAAIQFLVGLREPETRDQTWKFIQDNWEKVHALMTTAMGSYLVGGTGYFCSADARDQVTSFFASHSLSASSRAITRAQNAINDCIDLRSRQEPKLQQWIASQK
jgi:aminopeptidase N/puromycin-sensitive aminopeptidase